MTESQADSFPKTIAVAPLSRPVDCEVQVPGSKSITNRALIIASLASPIDQMSTVLSGALRSEDTEVMVDGLQRLGFKVVCNWNESIVEVHSQPDRTRLIPNSDAELFVANSGTSMRFLTALVSLGRGTYHLDGIPRMRERPIRDLLAALQQLGVDAASRHDNGCPPVVVQTNGLRGGQVKIRGDISSQYLSGLLMVAPLAGSDVKILVEGTLVSQPYVTMTLEMMRQFGAKVVLDNFQEFTIPGNQQYSARDFPIEPDASAASYFAGAAALCGGKVKILGLTEDSLQGDMRFLHVLEEMGCSLEKDSAGMTIRGGSLQGIDIDMNDISDTVMTLAAIACFADGPTTIRNVAHIRHKETDRLAALATELRRVGAEVEERADSLTIHPQALHGAEIETYNDHRMAMSFALVGLRVPGVVIKDPVCVTKTYPQFFQDLDLLRD